MPGGLVVAIIDEPRVIDEGNVGRLGKRDRVAIGLCLAYGLASSNGLFLLLAQVRDA